MGSGVSRAFRNNAFDSTPELLFAGILESDPAVAKWLRPAPNQFDIYWDHQTRKYQPDFVAETADRIYMLEVKAANEMDSREALEKAHAAMHFCKVINEYQLEHDKKPWRYLLLPDNSLTSNSSLRGLWDRHGLG